MKGELIIGFKSFERMKKILWQQEVKKICKIKRGGQKTLRKWDTAGRKKFYNVC